MAKKTYTRTGRKEKKFQECNESFEKVAKNFSLELHKAFLLIFFPVKNHHK